MALPWSPPASWPADWSSKSDDDEKWRCEPPRCWSQHPSSMLFEEMCEYKKRRFPPHDLDSDIDEVEVEEVLEVEEVPEVLEEEVLEVLEEEEVLEVEEVPEVLEVRCEPPRSWGQRPSFMSFEEMCEYEKRRFPPHDPDSDIDEVEVEEVLEVPEVPEVLEEEVLEVLEVEDVPEVLEVRCEPPRGWGQRPSFMSFKEMCEYEKRRFPPHHPDSDIDEVEVEEVLEEEVHEVREVEEVLEEEVEELQEVLEVEEVLEEEVEEVQELDKEKDEEPDEEPSQVGCSLDVAM